MVGDQLPSHLRGLVGFHHGTQSAGPHTCGGQRRRLHGPQGVGSERILHVSSGMIPACIDFGGPKRLLPQRARMTLAELSFADFDSCLRSKLATRFATPAISVRDLPGPRALSIRDLNMTLYWWISLAASISSIPVR